MESRLSVSRKVGFGSCVGAAVFDEGEWPRDSGFRCVGQHSTRLMLCRGRLGIRPSSAR